MKMYFGNYVEYWAILVVVCVIIAFLLLGCNGTPTANDRVAAEVIRVAAEEIVVEGLKDRPQTKVKLGILAGHAVELLNQGILQVRHVNLLLTKIGQEKFKGIASDLAGLLNAYIKVKGYSPDRLLTYRQMLFIRAFFTGVLEGCAR